MTFKIGCIVEGDGEVGAVPVLIRRIASDLYPELPLIVERPIRAPRNLVVKADELERRIELAVQKISGKGAIIIILDSDNDCPAELGPALLNRALQTRSDLPIAVVLAKCEFEAWFLAAAQSIRGQRGLNEDIDTPKDPETIRDAKGWLSKRMENSKTYSETRDQPAFAALFDIEQARKADSFDKCYRDIVRLLEELQTVNKQE
ncbi:MAG: DUF4276 family protein [Candidatus Poribacteria bacterium]|nr:DUF4276 family protein [Candidatus Poribacteria bacterium]